MSTNSCSEDDMICQLYLAKSAARHHVQESPSGRLEESHYCSDCYDAKYLKPSPDGSGLPRARFTIKTIMIVVCVSAVANAVAALAMRGGYVTGTQSELRASTIYAFLA
jgi:hypothetical protein